ncbi:hypothetical protein [Pantoea sp. JK]|uniref:hypothetical protein n=1 Tax=Pantoea sp. JK TaxID=2871703 RepID=UPI0022380407|nr:hypothetical protein [Pantoea sp. JK]MCW6030181.1 hypothetical protein [Pantoea sp. JK]
MKFMHVAFLASICFLAGCGEDHNITVVKNQKDNFFKGNTYGDVLSNWSMCESTNWEALSGNDKDIVKFTCVNKNLNDYISKIQTDMEVGFENKEKRKPSDIELKEINEFLNLSKVQEAFYFKVKDDRALPYKTGTEYFWSDGQSGYDDEYPITMFTNVAANSNDFYLMKTRNYLGDQYIPLRYNYIMHLFKRIKN